jgi:hypothetical protein
LQVKTSKNLTPSIIRDLNTTIDTNDGVMGILITLYEADNLVKEAKKYGTYKNNLLGKNYDKIQVIKIEEVMAGLRMEMPATMKVVKDAERKYKAKQLTMED